MALQPTNETVEKLCQNIAVHINNARDDVVKAVNSAMTVAYWQIGYLIVEEEQNGADRASYGLSLLEHLSKRLSADYSKGFSVSNLRYMRAFYLAYKNRIQQNAQGINEVLLNKNLSWSHYRILTRESRPEVREFYEVEAAKNYWSTP